MQYFNISGYTPPVSGNSMTVDVWPSSTLVQSSCSSPRVCFPLACSMECRCSSAGCQNRWRGGPAVQNSSCICLHNISIHACDVCLSAVNSRDRCSEAQGSVPLWLVAVILPLLTFLLIIGMFVALCRVRRQNVK